MAWSKLLKQMNIHSRYVVSYPNKNAVGIFLFHFSYSEKINHQLVDCYHNRIMSARRQMDMLMWYQIHPQGKSWVGFSVKLTLSRWKGLWEFSVRELEKHFSTFEEIQFPIARGKKLKSVHCEFWEMNLLLKNNIIQVWWLYLQLDWENPWVNLHQNKS